MKQKYLKATAAFLIASGAISFANAQTYPISSKCQQLDSVASARTFHLDPVRGSMSGDGSSTKPWKSLQDVVAAGYIGTKIVGGDTLLLLNGRHGSVSLRGVRNAAFLKIKAASSHKPVLTSISITDSSKLLIEGLEFQKTGTGEMIYTSPGSDNIVFHGNDLYSARDSSGYSASTWIKYTPNGFRTRGPCNTISSNKITNVRFGITMEGSDNVAHGNTIKNFSADGIRPIIGSRMIVRGNTIMDAYVSGAEGDSNHDDGIQMWGQNVTGRLYDLVIDGNTIIESTSPTRKFQNKAMHGIVMFDGVAERLTVTNNVVIVRTWWAIVFFAPRYAKIVSNTVAGFYQARVAAVKSDKTGAAPYRTVVKNNLTPTVLLTSGATGSYNVAYGKTTSHFVKHDATNFSYDLRLRSGSSAIRKGTSTDAPSKDILQKVRPNPPSIGAYEY